MMNMRGDVGGPVIGIGGLVWAAGMAIGILECFKWLKNGYLDSFALPQAFGSMGITAWGGIDQIAPWVWLQPLWAVVAFTGMGIAAIGFIIESNA